MKRVESLKKSIISNIFSLKGLAYTSIVFLFGGICCIMSFAHFQIGLPSLIVGLDETIYIINLIGFVGLINWIGVCILIVINRSQFDRNMAHANFKRLFYILLLVTYIPCILYLFYNKLHAPKILEDFNDAIINPFLNHENYDFSESLISLLGTFLLSGVLVSMLVNFINQRAERWEKGELRYSFRFWDYCIVIGGHDSVPSLVKQLVNKHKIVIVLTNRDVPSFRREVESCIEEQLKERVIFYHGYRNSKEDLKHLHLERNNLKAIYILGESRVHGEEETSHDTLNMTCLDIMNKLRGDGKGRIDCYVFFEHQTTSVIFQKFANNERYHSLNFIPYNFYELQAQKAIGWSNFLKQEKKQDNPLRLDRFGTDVVNADKHVHLVIIGMSKMGQALGMEAIRVCHYPNFAKAQMRFEYGLDADAKMSMGKRRTMITFIDYNMKEILDSFKCRYGRLLDEIQWRYVDYNYHLNSQLHPLRENNQKIVPDIELEFVNGRIQSEEVINHLKKISADSSAVLTIASCLSKSNLSIASILYLPKEVLEKAEIMIYQPDSIKLVESIAINGDSDKVKAFGVISQGVNLNHIVALETMAKRVNNAYLRKKVLAENCKNGNSTEKMTLSDFSESVMLKFERDNINLCESVWTVKEQYEIDWEMDESKRWANRYHASAIWQKIPYIIQRMKCMEDVITVGITEDDECLENSCEGLMARTEHNRWCIEQWLLDRVVKKPQVFLSYKTLTEMDDKLSHFPTNDQIMTMAIPYIVHDVIDSDTLNVS